ncbi:hypothetical protein F4677DRAFT_444259 [Hypoxylon crocopeplum]|nr:hypothetical protein F4677DRAFT_444259 [Hypoxylon crocopeplum]
MACFRRISLYELSVWGWPRRRVAFAASLESSDVVIFFLFHWWKSGKLPCLLRRNVMIYLVPGQLIASSAASCITLVRQPLLQAGKAHGIFSGELKSSIVANPPLPSGICNTVYNLLSR